MEIAEQLRKILQAIEVFDRYPRRDLVLYDLKLIRTELTNLIDRVELQIKAQESSGAHAPETLPTEVAIKVGDHCKCKVCNDRPTTGLSRL